MRTNIDGYNTHYHDLQIAENMPNITLATGPGGVGACTQALFNANQCLGTAEYQRDAQWQERARFWRGMGHHRHFPFPS